jgi:biotin transport system substrate-specific component
MSHALIPSWIESKNRSLNETQTVVLNVIAVMAGSVLLTLLARVSIVLPFTPVPITGQTFGVALLALSWGSTRAISAFSLYLLEGLVGLPVFAAVTGSATVGYLVGMFFACGVVGYLADQGYAKTIPRALLCCVVGSFCVFTFGLLGLAFFLPANALLKAGFLPFIPGDIIKNLLAAILSVSARRYGLSIVKR